MQTKERIISPIKQRILYFVDILNISKRDFYARTRISRGTLESHTGITEETMAKFIAIYPEINLIWLITGIGEMVCKEEVKSPVLEKSNFSIYKELLAEKEEEIKNLNREIGKLLSQIEILKKENPSTVYRTAAEPELKYKGRAIK